MGLVRAKDGKAHFSDLKHFARSPLHYRHHVENPDPPTKAMRIGTCAHLHLLGARPGLPLAVFKGKTRRGEAWEDFEAQAKADGAEIVSEAEYELGREIAAATLVDPVARKLLDGAHFEVPISWTDGGVECSTWGLDVVSKDGSMIADYKTTTSTKPDQLKAHAVKMLWHAQLAMYGRGARANGIDWKVLYLIATESKAPFATTVLEVTPEMLEEGNRCVTTWIEALRRAEDNDHWPAYAQHPEKWDPPAWMGMGIDLGGADDDDAEAAQ